MRFAEHTAEWKARQRDLSEASSDTPVPDGLRLALPADRTARRPLHRPGHGRRRLPPDLFDVMAVIMYAPRGQ
ncbi:hypothetical protein [Streptomyces sp. NBRC 110028]|uniref:hypothetical protein n=1 Tax=Streptomyces sp. NBRC 110028 TaxID=1621260 RepID=UPI000AC6EF8A|nr:hypothetical protein [Streptomyces sp. NBRC 110028]